MNSIGKMFSSASYSVCLSVCLVVNSSFANLLPCSSGRVISLSVCLSVVMGYAKKLHAMRLIIAKHDGSLISQKNFGR